MDTDKNKKEPIDLSGRIKDSEVKPEEGQKLPVYVFRPGTPKIIQWVIKYSGGLIKNENQAAYVLTGVVVLAIVVSLFLVFGGTTTEIKSPPPDLINVPKPE